MSEQVVSASKLLKLSKDRLSKDGFIPARRTIRDQGISPEHTFKFPFGFILSSCKAAQRLFKANPKITITIDPEKYSVKIQEDSVGMSQDDFCGDIMRVVSQYLPEEFLIQTYSRMDRAKYTVIASKEGYKIIDGEGPDSYGTTIVFTVSRLTDLRKILGYVAICVPVAGVDAYLKFEGNLESFLNDYSPDEFFGLENEVLQEFLGTKESDGTYKLGPIPYKEYFAKLLEPIKNAKLVYLELEDEDFTFAGGFASPSFYHRIAPTWARQARYDGLLIDAFKSILLSFCILDVKDPYCTAMKDDHILNEETHKKLEEKVKAKLQEFFSKQEFSTLRDIRSSEFYDVFADSEARYYILECLPAKLKSVVYLLNEPFTVFSYDEKKGVIVKEDKLLRDLGAEHLYYAKSSFTGRKFAILKRIDPLAVPFRLTKQANIKPQVNVEALIEYGVKDVDEVIKKESGAEAGTQYITVYCTELGKYFFGQRTKYKVARKNLHVSRTDKVIRVPKEKFNEYIGLLGKFKTDYAIARDRKTLECGIRLEEFLKGLRSKRVITNKGDLTFEEVSKYDKIYLIPYDESEAGRLFDDREELFVFGNGDLIFELGAYLTSKGAKFSIDSYGTLFNINDLIHVNMYVSPHIYELRRGENADNLEPFWEIVTGVRMAQRKQADELAYLLVQVAEYTDCDYKIKECKEAVVSMLQKWVRR